MKRSLHLGVVIICAMLLMLAAVNVFAEEAIRVHADLQIAAPQPGSQAQGDGAWFTVSENGREHYTVSGQWQVYNYETQAYEPFSGVFQAGQVYALELKATPGEGYIFADFSAKVLGKYVSWTEAEGLYRCSVPFSFAEELTEIRLGTLPEAMVGAAADHPTIEIPQGAGYTAEGAWLDRNGDPFTGTFLDGELYYFTVTLRPRAGYSFAPQMLLYTGNSGQNLDAEATKLQITTTFSFRPQIDQIVIDGVQDAAPGKTATVEGIRVPEDAPYTISQVYWADENWNPLEGSFREGNKYHLCMAFTLDETYSFAEGTKVTVNGVDAGFAYISGNRAEFDLDFSFRNTVDTIAIIDAPQALPGQAASTQGITLSKGCRLVSAVWKDQDGQEFTGVFEFGHRYTLSIRLAPEDGLSFAKDASLTVNNKVPDVWSILDDSASVELTFSLVKEITEITILGLADAQVGAPAETGGLLLPEDAPYKIQYAVWIDTATGQALEDGAVFELGKAYCLELALLPREGWEFHRDAPVTVNGMTPETCRVTPTYAYINLERAFLIPVTEVEIGDVQRPVAGHAIRPGQVLLPEDAPYTAQLEWIDGDTGEVLPEGTVFQAGKLYYCRILLRAAEAHELQEELRLTLNGTVDPDWPQWTFDKEEGAITLRYGRVQEPNPGPNPPTGDTGIALCWALALCALAGLVLLLPKRKG